MPKATERASAYRCACCQSKDICTGRTPCRIHAFGFPRRPIQCPCSFRTKDEVSLESIGFVKDETHGALSRRRDEALVPSSEKVEQEHLHPFRTSDPPQ